MPDQDPTNDDVDVTEGGLEHVIHEVTTGEEAEGEKVKDVYQFRQRIVKPDDPRDLIGEEQQASSENPPPLPPAEER